MSHRKIHIFVLLFLVTCVIEAQERSYATNRLKRIAESLSLSGFDILNSGEYDNFIYRGRNLTIRVNQWNEIEHIGLKLFNSSQRETYPSPVYDFLERRLLEENLYTKNSEDKIRMQWDKVFYLVGNPKEINDIDSTCNFSCSYEELHTYDVRWYGDNEVKLRMKFDMDYQLLRGCSIGELESNFIRRITRINNLHRIPTQQIAFPDNGDKYILNGDYFISPIIRNDVYFTKKGNSWQLVRDKKRVMHSISNLLIFPVEDMKNDIKMSVKGYDINSDTIKINYLSLLSFCVDEGCRPYFGFKQKENESLSGTVFFVNKKAGYLHMLSVRVPVGIIEEGKESVITGELFLYIPLFNVSDKVLNPKSYQPIESIED